MFIIWDFIAIFELNILDKLALWNPNLPEEMKYDAEFQK